ncbi:hypothetical protein B0A50_05511 [Salinomyces thailandicus]|uniref:Uncharacterized protein n=1 Tax=Salinomyces thailandicus TaxID=706561 RepID=A0A4V5N427_9PEZI|nr:hypothetical protein B0A50_05511 [Salinomyces thailandica]
MAPRRRSSTIEVPSTGTVSLVIHTNSGNSSTSSTLAPRQDREDSLTYATRLHALELLRPSHERERATLQKTHDLQTLELKTLIGQLSAKQREKLLRKHYQAVGAPLREAEQILEMEQIKTKIVATGLLGAGAFGVGFYADPEAWAQAIWVGVFVAVVVLGLAFYASEGWASVTRSYEEKKANLEMEEQEAAYGRARTGSY